MLGITILGKGSNCPKDERNTVAQEHSENHITHVTTSNLLKMHYVTYLIQN